MRRVRLYEVRWREESLMTPTIRYCTTTDGVRIAYCDEGEGPVVRPYRHFRGVTLQMELQSRDSPLVRALRGAGLRHSLRRSVERAVGAEVTVFTHARWWTISKLEAVGRALELDTVRI